jgi:hypothetical protein
VSFGRFFHRLEERSATMFRPCPLKRAMMYITASTIPTAPGALISIEWT